MAKVDVEQLQELLNLLMVLMAQKDPYGSILSLNWMAVDKLLMRIVWYVFCAHVMRREFKTPSDLKQHLQSKHPSIKHFHFLRAVSLVLSHLHCLCFSLSIANS